ncbi:MAG: hypothetical protein UV61_C0003G0090 [Candidatus Gottesmanbacteria bacterium GW2011_GWB1_43_11]|uniref:DUF1189 domain-containing protein n=1 Tax=Candidatus Gottesmanbacteria bacterium GW2011_GWB1_43_11 TaxID=1618446 RepID=A0A0G1CP30_9BACT|nr:MAG: hypothetical protein UV17_C0016G0028 [Candidatus Gottesmanbacteria bacterium GW2011_GWA1_42_26]KKS80982.1 MAG: hypothetical protein UV55_C0024G0006 [Candidatus Gottesmanbacteria bacterium GW2011_GWC1_43_10]KKS87237.1 MAG: hypothetical protein UV61_C0003G0090 [Candidatus Gottesmanbacteria bacterium GW2011_GWB1_43_11]OGG10628.1 MAG: hypothetical protein A2699_03450 [Candidatus Gottesmanbacteria bacterium RIFCSPHIGHO2_01_FULL_43_15]HCM37916.1 hypothetical protein [Patescibacteria group bac
MNKLSLFVRVFWKSMFSPVYYHDVVKAKFSFSLKYFLFFSFVLGLILTLSLTTVILPPLSKFSGRLQTRAAGLYPANLVITIKQGQLSTNQIEPLHFPIPYELFTDTPPAVSDQKQFYLLTIDTKASIEDYAKSQSLVFVTRDNVVMRDRESGYRLYPLKDAGNIVIDKQQVDLFLTQVLPWLNYVPWILGIVLFVGLSIFLPMTRLISLLILSLVLLAITKLMHISLSYGKIYQIGLHALTLPTLIQMFMSGLGFNPPIPFFNSLLFLFYSLIIFAELRKSPPEVINSTPPPTPNN